MKKITQHFVEKKYKSSFINETIIEEVEERNPLLIKNDKKMQGFRFFDKNIIIDGENIYNSDNTNYSNWIYFGERLGWLDVVNKYPNNRIIISNLRDNNFHYVCHTQDESLIPMDKEDLTFDEYVKKIEKEKILTKEKK